MLFPKWRTFTRLYSVFRHRYRLTGDERLLRDYLAGRPRKEAKGARARMTVEAPEDYFYYSLFGAIATALAARHTLTVDHYTLRSLRPGSSLSGHALFWNVIHYNFLSDRKWARLYGAFAAGIAWNAAASFTPWKEISLWLEALRIWRTVRTLDALLALEIRGIPAGDLVLDSYIRFKPAPEVDFKDAYLLVVIHQALKDVDNASRYFSRAKPKLYLTSYTTYIQHGIPARVATSLGIRTFSFGNYQQLTQSITTQDPCHVRNGALYKSGFLALPDQDEKLALAEKAFTASLGDGSDAADLPASIDVNGKPVIFLHDFFDSVHCYRWITFPDFWKWTCFTIETLQRAGIDFAVKPHPDQVTESHHLVEMLKRRYPGLVMIPAETDNQSLIRAGMACAITLYGTVAAEMAFLGVPSISCGDNPHIAFDFSNTARTPEEYETLLRNCRSLPRDTEAMRKEACMFYYMHNMNMEGDDRRLRDRALVLRNLLYSEPAPPAAAIIQAFSELEASPEFQAFTDRLGRHLA